MHDKTVVGWDGSKAADAALQWALERERERHGTIALVRVVDDTKVSAEYYVTEAEVDAAQKALATGAARIKDAAPKCFVTTTIVRGDPFEELIRYTNENWVLALGTKKHHAPRFRYGWSLGARIAAAANGPVAIIPLSNGDNRAAVVVGINASFESQVALEVAAAEALRLHEELILVHAWQEPAILAEEYAIDPRLVRAVEDQGEQMLALASDKILEKYPNLLVRRQLVHGPAELAMLDSGETAALLVVGSRHLRGVRRLLLGSVSHSVVINMPGPVIVVGQVRPVTGAPQPTSLTDAAVRGTD